MHFAQLFPRISTQFFTGIAATFTPTGLKTINSASNQQGANYTILLFCCLLGYFADDFAEYFSVALCEFVWVYIQSRSFCCNCLFALFAAIFNCKTPSGPAHKHSSSFQLLAFSSILSFFVLWGFRYKIVLANLPDGFASTFRFMNLVLELVEWDFGVIYVWGGSCGTINLEIKVISS